MAISSHENVTQADEEHHIEPQASSEFEAPTLYSWLQLPHQMRSDLFAWQPIQEVVSQSQWAAPVWYPKQGIESLSSIEAVNGDAVFDAVPFRLNSRAAFVFNVDSGEVLFSHNGDTRHPVASLTKLVSALTLMSEDPDLGQRVCHSTATTPSWPGADSWLEPGLCARGWDVLGAALVRSDNGAALSLPVISDLPFGAFVLQMNEVALDLGMEMSSFEEPSGVDDNNLSTARDITRAILATASHPVLSSVASAPFWNVEYDDGQQSHFRSTNSLMARRGDLEFVSAKTGYTDTARHCFSAVVETSSGDRLAVTTLGAPNSRSRWRDVQWLVRWASHS